MTNRVSILSFRIAVPAATTALVPLEVNLSPISQAMIQLEMWTTTAPVMISSGWRMKNRNGLVIPDNGSNEAGITLGAGEGGWAPLPNTRLKIPLVDKLLPGPPFDVTLQFYSTAAIEVGGILVVRDPVYDIHDLVKQMSSWLEQIKTWRTEKHG